MQPVGQVDTHNGPLDLRLDVREDGAVYVRLDDGLWTLLDRARFDGVYLRGAFSGDLGTEDASRTRHVLSVELRRRGNVLNGSVVALSLPAVRIGNALTHWAELRRPE